MTSTSTSDAPPAATAELSAQGLPPPAESVAVPVSSTSPTSTTMPHLDGREDIPAVADAVAQATRVQLPQPVPLVTVTAWLSNKAAFSSVIVPYPKTKIYRYKY